MFDKLVFFGERYFMAIVNEFYYTTSKRSIIRNDYTMLQ